MKFQTLNKGQLFSFGGTVWEKKSTRTAYLYDQNYDFFEQKIKYRKSSKFFYFGKNELVKSLEGEK